jgi:hypothetical protein
MSKKLLVEAPLNNLSFGNVSVNLLRELWRRPEISVGIWPTQAELSAFDKLPKEFGEWLQAAINARYNFLKKDIPVARQWHLNGAESKKNDKQYLFTFIETDSPTTAELAIVKLQEHTFFSSNYSVDAFKSCGLTNNDVSFLPLGFDEDFARIEKRLIAEDVIHFILVGKIEKRKQTPDIIQMWVKKYGNNKKYQLSLCISNPFLDQNWHNNFYAQVFGGTRPWNVNILPRLTTNSEMNQLYNSADIDLSGFSRAEGWGLPAFMCTGLGKWSIVSNCTAHKDWATDQNAILINPTGKEPAVDGIFFQAGQPFNQGNWFSFNMDEFVAKMELAETKARMLNVEGLKLREQFTYKKTVDMILEKIFGEKSV